MLNLEHQKILQTSILFSEFTNTEFKKSILQVSLCKVLNRHLLFAQNQIAKDFFLLLKGRIKLSFLSPEGNEKVIKVILPKHGFAEAIMFFKQRKYHLNATALGDSKVLRINADNYLKILKASPKSCFRIMGKLSQRLQWASGEIERMALYNGKYRLIKFLLANTRQTETSNSVHLSFPKNILASQLSIKAETLSRLFNELSKQGLIKINNNDIILLKPNQLESIIGI